MTTVVDTNVLIALWDIDDTLNPVVQSALDTARDRGALVVPAPVFAEALAGPGRSEAFLDTFFLRTRIRVEWDLGEKVWRTAGRAFSRHSSHRRRIPIGGPRRILADFLISAYAFENDFALLTLDDRLYRIAFPRLNLIAI